MGQPITTNPAPPKSWTVLQVFSKRAPRILSEAQDLEVGGFLPTYARVSYAGGKRSSTVRQLMPGYLFVRIGAEDRARVAELEGVYGVLPASPRLEAEMVPLVLGHASRAWNEVQAPEALAPRVRKRRPRPGKRIRARRRLAALHVQTQMQRGV